MDHVAFGGITRGLHYFGASFIVIASVIHMLRVVAFGSYKRPREVTWISGVLLLLVILAFALTGYLLPWDQKAYWATTVTINVARAGPFGEYVAGVLRGGDTLGALTLLRWYSAHVFLLPAALVTLVAAHLVLMRRHGISGPLRTSSEPREAVLPVPRAEGHTGCCGGVCPAPGAGRHDSGAARGPRRSDRRQLRAASRVVLPQPLPDAQVLPRSSGAGGDDGDSRTGGRWPAGAAVPRPSSGSASVQASAGDRLVCHRRRRHLHADLPGHEGHAAGIGGVEPAGDCRHGVRPRRAMRPLPSVRAALPTFWTRRGCARSRRGRSATFAIPR